MYLVHDIVNVEVDFKPLLETSPAETAFKFYSAMFYTDYLREHLKADNLYGEIFIERPQFKDLTDMLMIHIDNMGFRTKNIFIDLFGNITASIEWMALDKLHVMKTYGDLHYVARGVYDPGNITTARIVTIDCIAKKPLP